MWETCVASRPLLRAAAAELLVATHVVSDSLTGRGCSTPIRRPQLGRKLPRTSPVAYS
jgi:hypothetical protein